MFPLIDSRLRFNHKITFNSVISHPPPHWDWTNSDIFGQILKFYVFLEAFYLLFFSSYGITFSQIIILIKGAQKIGYFIDKFVLTS